MWSLCRELLEVIQNLEIYSELISPTQKVLKNRHTLPMYFGYLGNVLIENIDSYTICILAIIILKSSNEVLAENLIQKENK